MDVPSDATRTIETHLRSSAELFMLVSLHSGRLHQAPVFRSVSGDGSDRVVRYSDEVRLHRSTKLAVASRRGLRPLIHRMDTATSTLTLLKLHQNFAEDLRSPSCDDCFYSLVSSALVTSSAAVKQHGRVTLRFVASLSRVLHLQVRRTQTYADRVCGLYTCDVNFVIAGKPIHI